jgi:hypothetical protein
MKRAAIVGALALGMTGLAVPGHATALATENLLVNVPFAFQVEGARMPAGNYMIREGSDLDLGLLEIRSRDGHHAAFFFTEDDGVRSTRGAMPALVFDRFGHKRFLRSVQLDNGEGEQLFATRNEIETARELAGVRPGATTTGTSRSSSR